MIMQAVDIAQQSSNLNAQAIRQALEGNLCRCMGYQNTGAAVAEGSSMMGATNSLARET